MNRALGQDGNATGRARSGRRKNPGGEGGRNVGSRGRPGGAPRSPPPPAARLAPGAARRWGICPIFLFFPLFFHPFRGVSGRPMRRGREGLVEGGELRPGRSGVGKLGIKIRKKTLPAAKRVLAAGGPSLTPPSFSAAFFSPF